MTVKSNQIRLLGTPDDHINNLEMTFLILKRKNKFTVAENHNFNMTG